MSAAEVNGTSGHVNDESDEDASEAQAQVIASLRAQVTDLFSQVTQLNGKLVASYDRMSGLEDQLHDASSSLRNASLTISSLELERSHHLAALNTGLLVEKAHVTTELNRLMERATEEAARRGQAESARRDIEKDLDDLSATLFDQANTMVAEARLGQARSERKVQDAEQALKFAEDAVKDMQVQMQVLQADKEVAERDAQDARLTMRKGKWIEHDDPRAGDVPRIRFMTTHTPYAEFVAFVAHLRSLRGSTQPTPPAISTLLTQPFIARLLSEDSEPTVRLDLAPSLNWLSRRSVLAAIHAGMLTVEPLPFLSLIQELHQHAPSASNSSLSCALCGTLVARFPGSPASRTHHTNGGSWFKYPLALGSTQNLHAGTPQSAQCEPPEQVYVFRVTAAPTPTPPPLPVHTSSASMSTIGTSSRPPLHAITSSRVLQSQTQNSPHPLCTSNYCLTRLRSTCTLWAFVRVGILERIWEEEVVQTPKPLTGGENKETSPLAASDVSGTNFPAATEKPPVPPRRRKLWEMASAFGERATSWGKESGENAKPKEKETKKVKETLKTLPAPPPSHPSVPHPHAESPTSRVDTQDRPQLPKRNITRSTVTTDPVASSSDTQSGVTTPETTQKDLAADANGHIDPDKADRSTPLDETTFAAPPSEASPSPSTTPHPVATEPQASPIQDQLPPPSPSTIPLPMTPTPSKPISRMSSPAPRPRSQPSGSSPPSNSRPASPAVSRSRAGSPAPSGIARATSPSPGQPPSISHIRGKMATPSPLASSRPASPAPAGAPPLPRRAAARRAVPPPPPLGTPKAATEETGKEDAASPAITTVDPTPETDSPVIGEPEIPTDVKNREREVVKEAAVCEVAPLPTDTANDVPGPAKEVTPIDAVNDESVVKTSDPLPPSASEDGTGRTSMDTTSTKQSSNTEGEGFASDATWEERTWKELVRLKEDMFWARIGGIRASQG